MLNCTFREGLLALLGKAEAPRLKHMSEAGHTVARSNELTLCYSGYRCIFTSGCAVRVICAGGVSQPDPGRSGPA